MLLRFELDLQPARLNGAKVSGTTMAQVASTIMSSVAREIARRDLFDHSNSMIKCEGVDDVGGVTMRLEVVDEQFDTTRRLVGMPLAEAHFDPEAGTYEDAKPTTEIAADAEIETFLKEPVSHDR